MLDEPLGEPHVRRYLRNTLQSGALGITRHAYEEMDADGLVEQDIRNCLWAGQFDGCNLERGTWRYRVRTARMVVVVAFRSETQAVVVTAWRD